MTFNSSFERSRHEKIEFDNDIYSNLMPNCKIQVENLKKLKLEKTSELSIWRFLSNELE